MFSYIIQLIFQVFFMYKELLYQGEKKEKRQGRLCFLGRRGGLVRHEFSAPISPGADAPCP